MVVRMEPKRSIDTRGTFSPYPEMDARDALKALAKGEVLEVVGDDPVARTTIPSLCNRLGYFYEIIDEAQSRWRLLIEKTT